ncbi:energy transducer TonB [Wenzhouxiangella sp. EGI_FJ10409]|uniref:energy transducer TonB n=1 Tax=Wenzhouxiangella sp. EGI_FJ10409 TaxID=3243767 RepID=UPI0035E16A73
MTSVLRYLATVALAAVVTLSAFYLMHRLIDHEGTAPVSHPPVTSIRFGPVDIPDPPEDKVREMPEKPEPQEPLPTNDVIAEVEQIDRSLDIEASRNPTRDSVAVYTADFANPSARNNSGGARPVATVPPPYPREAALNGIEGWVRVSVEIDAHGRVGDVRVLEAEPRGVFDQAAIQAVRRWTWKPAIVDGQPRAQTVVQELAFDLDQ